MKGPDTAHTVSTLSVPYFTAHGPDAISRFVLDRDFRDYIY